MCSGSNLEQLRIERMPLRKRMPELPKFDEGKLRQFTSRLLRPGLPQEIMIDLRVMQIKNGRKRMFLTCPYFSNTNQMPQYKK